MEFTLFPPIDHTIFIFSQIKQMIWNSELQNKKIEKIRYPYAI